MRKVKLACLLLACVFIVSGCVPNDLPIKRKTNGNIDVIKFYGFEWLTEKSTIEKKFDQDFGSDYVCKENPAVVNNGIDAVNVIYQGKNEADLNWTVADHNVSQLQLLYIKGKSGKYYLCRGIWLFNNCNAEDEEFFITRLDKLYPNTKADRTVFSDKNANQINLSYTDSTKEITLDYCCYDILYQLLYKGEENNNLQENN